MGDAERDTQNGPVEAGAAAEQAAADAAGNGETAEAGSEVEHDLDELVAKAAQRDEYLQLAQRTQADFENYRKRMAREAQLAEGRGVTKLAKELLPALDNLERALSTVDGRGEETGSGDGLVEGFRLVHAELTAALARTGIEPFSPLGEPFDPERHEAIAQTPRDGAEPGTVIEVYQQGWSLGEGVLRPARVVVAG
jgi:molecular chaperone GrpE